MSKKVSVPRHPGVFVTESSKRMWHEKPDKVYWLAFMRDGKVQWERCGWASEGWTSDGATRRRHEILVKERAGEYRTKKQLQQECLTLDEFMQKHYLPWGQSNKKHPRDDASRYENWLKPRLGGKPLTDISVLDVERLKRDIKVAGRADATVRHVLGLLRNIFNMAVEWKVYDGQNPVKAVRFPRSDNSRQRFLSVEESELLLGELYTHSRQVGNMATLALYGGLRLGEIVNLKWGHIDVSNRLVHVVDTKNNESRTVRMTEPIKQVFEELSDGSPDDFIFQTNKKTPVVFISKTFARCVDKLGLNAGITDPRRKACFHTLRHTWASWAAMAGTPLAVLGKCLGHRTLQMTQRYSHLSAESALSAFDAVERFAHPSESKKDVMTHAV